MATLACHASHVSSSSIPACATDEWQGDLDEDGFIQEDDSVPACIEHSEADSEDVLEALIQAELAKFQQQQADKYAELLSDGHALMPLSSPAPVQQQLRAQQRQQEVLIDVASLHEQERYEYVPSARATLDAEQLMLQHSAGLQGAASSYTLEQRQQVVEAEHSQVCAEPDSTASLYEDSPQCSNPAETVCAAGAPTLASAESHAEEPPPAAAGSAVACKYGSQGGADPCMSGIDPAACDPSDLQPCSPGTADAAEGMQQLADACSQGSCPRSSTDHACTDAACSELPAELPAEAEPQPAAAHTSMPCADLPRGPASAAAAVPDASAHADVASTAEAGAAADKGWQNRAEGLEPLQPQEQEEDPAQMQYVAQQLSKLQLQQAFQASIDSDCSSAGEPAGAAGEVCSAQDSIMPTEPLLEPCESGVECPELPFEQSEQLVLQEQEGYGQQHGLGCHEDQPHELQEQLQQQHEPGQQQQQPRGDVQAGDTGDTAVTHVDAEPQASLPVQSWESADGQLGPDRAAPLAATPDAAAAMAAPADVAAGHSLAASGADRADSEGCIYQDDADQSASPASPSSPATAVAAAAHAPALDSWQAAAARTSSDAAAAAAAVFAAMSLGAVGIGELSPWETAGAAEVAPNSAQHNPALWSSRQSPDSSRLSPRWQQSLRQQSPRPPQSPRQQSPRHQRVQQQHHGPTSAELAQPQHAQQQLQQPHQSFCRASHRPSSAPVGGSRHKITMVGPAAAQLALRTGAQASAGLPVVTESSREGPCRGRLGPRQVESQLRQPVSTQMQFYTGAAAVAEWTSSMHHQQHQEEQQYQQQILARMQQLQQPARPVSADPWRRSSSQPRGQHMPSYEQQQRMRPQQRQQQQHRRAGPAWDDSPMPLHVPKWVPIAQAVQLPSTTVAANVAYCSWGSGLGNSILGGMRGAWLADAVRADAGGRPQTAGPAMSHSHMQPWEPVQQQPLDRSGCLTARSASSSPGRWRSTAQPTSSSAAAAASTAAAVSGGEAEHGVTLSSCSAVPAGQSCRNPSPTDRAGSSSSSGCRAQASTYLLDVQQQIRQANSYCRQLGLSTQYKLAEGDGKKDKWQLEQIEIELWTMPSSSSVREGQQQHHQQQLHAVGDCQWQLRKRLSMPQFTAHLNRLKGSNPAAVAPPGPGSAVPAAASIARPSHSAYAALPAGAAGSTASWVASCAAPSAQRALSPDRFRVRNPQACGVAVLGNSNAGAGVRRASSNSRGGRMYSASTCQLLVLSPRASTGSEQVQRLIRPASAPRGCSRLSPRRQ